MEFKSDQKLNQKVSKLQACFGKGKTDQIEVSLPVVDIAGEP